MMSLFRPDRGGFQPGKPRLDHGQPFFQSLDTRFGGFLASASPRRHLHYRVILVPAHQIERANRLVDPGPDDSFSLLPQAGQSRDGATGDPGDVVEEPRTVRHCLVSFRVTLFLGGAPEGFGMVFPGHPSGRLPPASSDFYNPPP